MANTPKDWYVLTPRGKARLKQGLLDLRSLGVHCGEDVTVPNLMRAHDWIERAARNEKRHWAVGRADLFPSKNTLDSALRHSGTLKTWKGVFLLVCNDEHPSLVESVSDIRRIDREEDPISLLQHGYLAYAERHPRTDVPFLLARQHLRLHPKPQEPDYELAFDSLSELLNDDPERHAFTLTGRSGIGKSTCLSALELFLTDEIKRGCSETFAHRVSLQSGRAAVRSPLAWLRASWEKKYGSHVPFCKLLRDGRLVLLIDDAEHISGAQLSKWRSFIGTYLCESRVIFVSLEREQGPLSSEDLLVYEVEVAPLDIEAMTSFLQARLSYAAFEVAQDLIQRDLALAELCTSPLFLSLMARALAAARGDGAPPPE